MLERDDAYPPEPELAAELDAIAAACRLASRPNLDAIAAAARAGAAVRP
jgi:uncharacterized protein (UPF0276 family)